MHLLVSFFDYFLGDGSHGFSKYGWKWVPIAILTSCGDCVPIGAFWGLEEDTASLQQLIRLFRQHCVKNGVDPAAFQLRETSSGVVVVPVSVDTEGHDWAKTNLRNFVYAPEMEQFLVALVRGQVSDEMLQSLACYPQCAEPTLHCDSGPALISLAKFVRWCRTACAKHLEANIPSLKPELKEQVKRLIYDRHISLTMAFELRDKLIADVNACDAVSAKTREWIKKTFGSDEAMSVSAFAQKRSMW